MLGRLILITGAQAAGKTTIGHALAARLPKAVHVDGDAIHAFVVSGAVGYDEPPPPGAVEQLHLRYEGGLAVANVYRANGFDAVISDNIFGPDVTDLVEKAHKVGNRVHVVVLDPGLEAIEDRYLTRGKGGYTDSITPQGLIDAVRRDTPRIGLWLDTTGQTVEETTTALLARLDEAIVSP